jgi:hypothetical protein
MNRPAFIRQHYRKRKKRPSDLGHLPPKRNEVLPKKKALEVFDFTGQNQMP